MDLVDSKRYHFILIFFKACIHIYHLTTKKWLAMKQVFFLIFGFDRCKDKSIDKIGNLHLFGNVLSVKQQFDVYKSCIHQICRKCRWIHNIQLSLFVSPVLIHQNELKLALTELTKNIIKILDVFYYITYVIALYMNNKCISNLF